MARPESALRSVAAVLWTQFFAAVHMLRTNEGTSHSHSSGVKRCVWGDVWAGKFWAVGFRQPKPKPSFYFFNCLVPSLY